MFDTTLRKLVPLLAGSILVVAGCQTPAAGPVAEPEAMPKFSLLGKSGGLGAIAMKVVDMRKPGYRAQAVADADLWDQVTLRLSSAKRLKQDRKASLIPSHPTDSRQVHYETDALGQLPPSNDYSLEVTLASASVVLGQGASTSINVAAGEIKPVTIYINTVGAISFENPDYHEIPLGTTDPHLYFPDLVVNSTVSVKPTFPAGGEAQFFDFTYDIRRLDGSVLLASPSAHALAYPGTGIDASASVVVPDPGTDDTVAKVTVFSRKDGVYKSAKSRLVRIIKGGVINADLQ